MDINSTNKRFFRPFVVTSQYFEAVAGVPPRHTGHGRRPARAPQVFEKIPFVFQLS
jgi:hypothetical protein